MHGQRGVGTPRHGEVPKVEPAAGGGRGFLGHSYSAARADYDVAVMAAALTHVVCATEPPRGGEAAAALPPGPRQGTAVSLCVHACLVVGRHTSRTAGNACRRRSDGAAGAGTVQGREAAAVGQVGGRDTGPGEGGARVAWHVRHTRGGRPRLRRRRAQVQGRQGQAQLPDDDVVVTPDAGRVVVVVFRHGDGGGVP